MKYCFPLMLMGITLLVFATIQAAGGEYDAVEEPDQERACIEKHKRCGSGVSVNPCCRGTKCRCRSFGGFESLCNCS
uniref:U13-Deinotoxin-Dsu1a_1 n=1 Tax=Deinopis subrufa TaxID=1905329 RepID=A0A4Q8KCZ9_DEISU